MPHLHGYRVSEERLSSSMGMHRKNHGVHREATRILKVIETVTWFIPFHVLKKSRGKCDEKQLCPDLYQGGGVHGWRSTGCASFAFMPLTVYVEQRWTSHRLLFLSCIRNTAKFWNESVPAGLRMHFGCCLPDAAGKWNLVSCAFCCTVIHGIRGRYFESLWNFGYN